MLRYMLEIVLSDSDQASYAACCGVLRHLVRSLLGSESQVQHCAILNLVGVHTVLIPSSVTEEKCSEVAKLTPYMLVG